MTDRQTRSAGRIPALAHVGRLPARTTSQSPPGSPPEDPNNPSSSPPRRPLSPRTNLSPRFNLLRSAPSEPPERTRQFTAEDIHHAIQRIELNAARQASTTNHPIIAFPSDARHGSSTVSVYESSCAASGKYPLCFNSSGLTKRERTSFDTDQGWTDYKYQCRQLFYWLNLSTFNAGTDNGQSEAWRLVNNHANDDHAGVEALRALKNRYRPQTEQVAYVRAQELLSIRIEPGESFPIFKSRLLSLVNDIAAIAPTWLIPNPVMNAIIYNAVHAYPIYQPIVIALRDTRDKSLPELKWQDVLEQLAEFAQAQEQVRLLDNTNPPTTATALHTQARREDTRDNPQAPRPQRQVTCFNCDAAGHTSRECNERSAFCDKCGGRRHLTKHCRLNQFGKPALHANPYAGLTCLYVPDQAPHINLHTPDAAFIDCIWRLTA